MEDHWCWYHCWEKGKEKENEKEKEKEKEIEKGKVGLLGRMEEKTFLTSNLTAFIEIDG